MTNRKPSVPSKIRQSRKRGLFRRPAVILAVLVAMSAGAVYLWIAGGLKKQLKSAFPATAVATPPVAIENETIVGRVARHLLVDQNEQPFVATVSDVEAVKAANPVFYKDVELGDKVLIWSDRAVIYSPSKDKIVAVAGAFAPAAIPSGSVSTTPMAGLSSSSTLALEQVAIEVRNGSGVNGAARQLRVKLHDAGLTVSRVGDAQTRFASTVIVDLTKGAAPNVLSKLMTLTGGKLSPLPKGEQKTEADFLVILGRISADAP